MKGKRNRRGIFERIPMTKSLLLGQGIYFAVVETIILVVTFLFFRSSLILWTLGFMEGAAIAALMTLHMAMSLDDAVTMLEDEALKHTRFTYAIRMIVLLAAFLLIGFLHLGDVVAALLGLMSLKVSAYLQSYTNKFLSEGR